jgi:hypothetical protein
MTRLMLDYDGAMPDHLIDRIIRLVSVMEWRVISVRCDRTMHGWHVIIEMRERIAFAFVVAAQAILGSDANREAFNLQRARRWRHVPPEWRQRANVLYLRHIRRMPVWRRSTRRNSAAKAHQPSRRKTSAGRKPRS